LARGGAWLALAAALWPLPAAAQVCVGVPTSERELAFAASYEKADESDLVTVSAALHLRSAAFGLKWMTFDESFSFQAADPSGPYLARLSDDRGLGAFVTLPAPKADFLCLTAGFASIGATFSRFYYDPFGRITERLFAEGTTNLVPVGVSGGWAFSLAPEIQAAPFVGLSYEWTRTRFDEFDTSESSHDWGARIGAGMRFGAFVGVIGYERSFEYEDAPASLSAEVRLHLGI
jgi:hypothetical protein